MRYKLIALVLSLSVSSAHATVINFEDFAADNDNGGMPAARYSSLGITFVATDNGKTWGGLGAGDPGNWDLAGTNGDTFSGFNGNSYGLTTLFSSSVSGFSLDVSRANGSSDGNTFTLEGWLGGVMVETHTVNLGAINEWQTVFLSSAVDKTVWSGAGSGFHPYGIDNLSWRAVPEPGSLLVLGLGATCLMRRRKG